MFLELIISVSINKGFHHSIVLLTHDDVVTWGGFSHHCALWGIHRLPLDSAHKGWEMQSFHILVTVKQTVDMLVIWDPMVLMDVTVMQCWLCEQRIPSWHRGVSGPVVSWDLNVMARGKLYWPMSPLLMLLAVGSHSNYLTVQDLIFIIESPCHKIQT